MSWSSVTLSPWPACRTTPSRAVTSIRHNSSSRRAFVGAKFTSASILWSFVFVFDAFVTPITSARSCISFSVMLSQNCLAAAASLCGGGGGVTAASGVALAGVGAASRLARMGSVAARKRAWSSAFLPERGSPRRRSSALSSSIVAFSANSVRETVLVVFPAAFVVFPAAAVARSSSAGLSGRRSTSNSRRSGRYSPVILFLAPP
mmetsp:Transcript_10820/g.32557  ORF Transcript_10820/g.32557 Transcript_10820/m.32557 type:complete len:205 (+) Transcript_10820:1790-2404(+)